MKALAFSAILLGFIAFWSFKPEAINNDGLRSEAVAINYGQFRNAVFDYAQKMKTSGVIVPGDPGLTALPFGWKNIRAWEGLTQEEGDGRLYCYVYGPAQPQEVVAVQKLFNQSMAVGWNNAGVFIRNGGPLALPPVIPHGAVVSVMRID